MKSLFERLSPESLAIIEREHAKYEATVGLVIKDLKSNHFPIYITFETALWLMSNVCPKRDVVEVFYLFEKEKEEEVGS